MTSNIAEATFLILLAALMNATYTLPMKLNRQWAWEHSWFAFTFLGVAVVPTLIAVATVPGLWAIYPQIPAATLMKMAVFGATWGVSLVLFGLSISIVGVAITFAVCLGTSAASGALIPLLIQHPDRLQTREGALILGGIFGILSGVGLCGLAGYRRDRAIVTKRNSTSLPFARGLLYAIVSGVTGSMLNLGLAFGGPIQERAREQGASAAMMSNAVWLPGERGTNCRRVGALQLGSKAFDIGIISDYVERVARLQLPDQKLERRFGLFHFLAAHAAGTVA